MQAARCPLQGRLPLRISHGLRGVLGVRAWRTNVPPCGDAAACQRLIAARAVKPENVLQSDAVQAATVAAAAARPAWRWEESEDATKAYAVLAATLLFGLVPGLETQKWADLPYFISLALCTIYIGAHRGLTTSSRQQISVKEGILAPVFASGALFGCYLLIKFLPDLNLQTLLNAYFWILGSIAISTAAMPVLRRNCGSLGEKSIKFDAPEGLLLDNDGKPVTRVELAPTDIVAVALAVCLTTAELASNHSNFSLNNMVACLVASEILQLLGLRSFRTAAVLLVGLLCYDVFWVFASPHVVGANVMLTVATSDAFVGPTRLLFPKVPGGMGEAASFPYSLLGLGDIAVPGLLACLALRYDASRSTDMRARATAAAEAISDALGAMESSASAEEMAEAAADAASTAYDRVADQELQQRNSTLNGNGAASRSAANANSSQNGSSSSSSTSTSNRNSSEATSSSSGEPQRGAPMHVSDAVLEQRTYFKPVLGAYVFGLLSAFAANSITSLGQPALLYIVPATLSAVFVTAASRNELGRVWSFTDVPTFGLQQTLLELEQEEMAAKSKNDR